MDGWMDVMFVSTHMYIPEGLAIADRQGACLAHRGGDIAHERFVRQARPAERNVAADLQLTELACSRSVWREVGGKDAFLVVFEHSRQPGVSFHYSSNSTSASVP